MDRSSTLTGYVPAFVVRRAAADPAMLKVPSKDSRQSAVLFTDISGFTVLSQRLAERGPAGAEELSQTLSDFFEPLIDVVTSNGGDVVNLAGDALIAVWPATDEDLPAVSLRAAQCGLAIQTALGDYETADGTRLFLRTSIGAGEFATALTGGVDDRWELLVVGDPLSQVSKADTFAQPGDVVVSPAAWQLVRERCEGDPLAEGNTRLASVRTPLAARPLDVPDLSNEGEEALRGLVPNTVLTRLSVGQSDWLAELRRITVLFVNLLSVTYDTSLERLQEAICALQTALNRYEGSLNELSADDKGTTVVAALGLPPLSHEDDIARGVLAALRIQADLLALGVETRVGVATGLAYCGFVGGTSRRQYKMVGSIVNLAARLMVAARPGEVLCDEPTYRGAQTRQSFVRLPKLSLKGFASPVAAYRPNTPEQTEAGATPISGRHETPVPSEHHLSRSGR